MKVISWREEERERKRQTDRQAGSRAELAEQKERERALRRERERKRQTDRQAGSQAELAEQKERERALRQMTHYDASLQGSTGKKHSP